MTTGLLTGFRVLDITDAKGFVCGKILATLGAEVIKIEPPGGDPSRRIPPYFHNIDDPNRSLYWFSFNTDKKSITLNLNTEEGRELFNQLIQKADFILESQTPGYLDSIGIGYETLSKLNPRIIMTSITHFGQKGPHSCFKGSELVDTAMGGVLEINGHPDRPPVKEALESAYFRANAAAAMGTVISHYYREISGEGQQVDVSIQEVETTRFAVNMLTWEFDRRLLKRNGPHSQFGAKAIRDTWSCKDGYVRWQLQGGKDGSSANRALSKWLDESGMENPFKKVNNLDELDITHISAEFISEIETVVGKFFLLYTKAELTEQGIKRGLHAAAINNPAEVMKNDHLRARNFWTKIVHPELNRAVEYPKYFFLSTETGNYTKNPAPTIGQHNIDIYANLLGISIDKIDALKAINVI
jgi:crotonobetainyl-CoA:carnitine CoA-transferase CaiB-like acyl-CoA transferase